MVMNSGDEMKVGTNRGVSAALRVIAAGGLMSAGLLLGACNGDDDEPIDLPDYGECNPIAIDVDCLLPFPSDFFRVEVEGGGYEVRFPEAALPAYRSGAVVDFSGIAVHDGFSVHPPIFTWFGQTVDDAGLTFYTDDVSTTLQPSSTTLVLNASTGEPVLHFAELDRRTSDDAARIVQIRLLTTLEPATRYIVAIQGLDAAGGGPLPALEGFRYLRDRQARSDEAWRDLQSHYDDAIFPVLETFGVQRGELLAAWDFTTRSDTSARADLLAMRAIALEWLDENAPEVTITAEITDEAELNAISAGLAEHARMVIRGTFTAPLLLENAAPGARINRDAQGQPALNGTTEVPFLVVLPFSGEDAEEPLRFLQFGHGFFGNTSEITSSFAPAFGNQYGFAFGGINWWGMSSDDLGGVIAGLTSTPSSVYAFSDRVLQSFINNIVFTDAAMTTLRDAPEVAIEGEPSWAQETYFYGISLGHILGSSAVAVNPAIDRAVFSVGGASFSFMMSRAGPFLQFLQLLEPQFPVASRGLDTQKFIALSSLALDRIDPSTWTSELLRASTLEVPVDRTVLAQVGIGDTSVPTISSEIWAASAGLANFSQSAKPIAGVETGAGETADSSIVIFDFQLDGPTPGIISDIPATNNSVHVAVRASAVGQQQIDAFLRPSGLITEVCDGVCDPN